MQADNDDRLGGRDSEGRHSNQTLIIAIAVIILAGGAYLFAPKDDDADQGSSVVLEAEPETIELRPAPMPEPVAAVVSAPDIPPEVVDEPAPPEPTVEEFSPPPPPTPEELDAMLRAAMAEVALEAGPGLEAAFAAPYLMDRAVSSVDQLARGLVPRRTTNLARPSGGFAVTGVGENKHVDPAGYLRYDAVVNSITAIPPGQVAALFHNFRDQLQTAYAALGYPADKADNTLIAALDAVISAPVRSQPPALVSKGALWAYADPSLEKASDLHKQLLRTGPENTRKLKNWAQELKTALLKPAR